ncbi:Lipoxygenase [Melia azedarach]|uniref:Lipoxygenase n=1 Tax=Melia azedarach TaxID=155640 RepID=A0ACC1YMG3_MELAZ|nr:Lipoxygenase [Melia azedarach]
MLKPQQVQQSQSSITTLFPISKPFLHGSSQVFLPVQASPFFKTSPKIRISIYHNNNIKALFGISTKPTTKVKAVITVKPTVISTISPIDEIEDLLGQSLELELVSAELDRQTGLEKSTIKGSAWRQLAKDENENIVYKAEFKVPESFGEVGAILVQNEHHSEMYLNDILLTGFQNGPVTITCGSWVQSEYTVKDKRIFFTDKSFLPSRTPDGLKRLRAEELANLRGNGQGQRKASDRIYDYDAYNDLGNPDSDREKARPVLGGKERPYPRRCRTGRARCKTDPKSESRSNSINYLPRDEAFSEIKQAQFTAKTLYSALHALIPTLEAKIIDNDLGFPNFTEIDKLFNEGNNVPLPPALEEKPLWQTILPRLIKGAIDTEKSFLRFETPEAMDRDKFFWFRDQEFCRETLAGLNPYSLKLVTEWPLTSKLDPAIYGPAESAITRELIEKEIGGVMSLEDALREKKLFILDYHDLLLPYVEKVRQIKGSVLYGSRTLLFLNADGTLRPLAIELTRPPNPMDGKPQWKRVFSPSWQSTECWLWRLAKAHVLAHDSGYHQLVSHWLRTHCCVEPYVIATNRQLSAMHPINRLLKPHFRYTMEINALARQLLINAAGVIESTFTPRKYSMEFSSVAYDKEWRFDYEALPKDLIKRGLAVEDPNSPHGLRLTIEDYPYANDGLDIWASLKQWVTDYVNHYYPGKSLVEYDEELQAWWTEIRTVGHGDKKDEPWWPVLKTPDDLIEIITTMIWVTSGHHAAVNFGQYTFAGYFPNRPTIARTKMPTEDKTEEDWKFFIEKPELALLRCFPSQIQATKVMVTMDTLSSHSPDEEYLGKHMEQPWAADPVIRAAFERFSARLREIEGIIDARNANENLHNRNGAGIVPYELLKPTSGPGVTGKGIPYSISI